MNFPEKLLYSKDHEWLQLLTDGVALIGITAFAAGELGDIVYVDVAVDQKLAAGEVFGSIEAVKTVSDLFLPVSAQLLELNPLLAVSPELVNQDPYGEGWILKVKLTHPLELHRLMGAAAYKKLIGHV